MSDHSHYGEYADYRHGHEGDYAAERHDHDLDYAEKHHRHYDDESTARGLREDLSLAEARIHDLEDNLRDALNRIHVLEDQAPQYEADLATADLAGSGYDRHPPGCPCPYCPPPEMIP